MDAIELVMFTFDFCATKSLKLIDSKAYFVRQLFELTSASQNSLFKKR